jgi:hypothetical protein
LEKCGPVEALLMPPNKPYAFVIFQTIEESKKAYFTLNGKEIIDDLGQKIFLYLNFVEKGTLTLASFNLLFLCEFSSYRESLSIILYVWEVCAGVLDHAVPVGVKG